MKRLGLLGGMSSESTEVYYRHLNHLTRQSLGGLHSCDLVMRSFDFAEVEECQARGDWAEATKILSRAAQDLQSIGAEGIVICTNTMHKLVEDIQKDLKIPIIHIADATAAEIKRRDLRAPLLLATRYTMEQDFYKGRLSLRHGIDVRTPDNDDRGIVHNIIYDELCQGIVRPESKMKYLGIIEKSVRSGADCVIMGCTEIGLLISQADFKVPALDTALIHAEAAVHFALNEKSYMPKPAPAALSRPAQ